MNENDKDISIVIARYNENLDWIKDIPNYY